MSESTVKYFYATNSNQRICGVAFEPVDLFAGTVCGVFQTSDANLISQFAGQKHVEEITQADYEAKLKKKAPTFSEFKHSNKPTSSPAPALKGEGVVVVESPSNTPNAALVTENILEARPLAEPSAPISRRKSTASKPIA